MRFAVNDGPGIRTTVFLKGCPLACLWCHNPESQRPTPELILRPERCIRCGRCRAACPQGLGAGEPGATASDTCQACGRCVTVCPADAREIAGRPMAPADVLAEIGRDRVFHDQSGGGATFSGGEPLAQPRFLLECLKMCQAAGIHTVVDTSGWAEWPVLLTVGELTDLFLYDLKVIDPELHRRYAGVDNQLILDNLSRLSAVHEGIIVRLPVIPGVSDSEANAADTAAFLRARTRVREVTLLPYHATGEPKYARLGRTYAMTGTVKPSDDHLRRLADIYSAAGLEPHVGG